MGETIQITTLDGQSSFGAYSATPAEAPRGAIVVIQEIFGVNAGIRSKVDDWAALGYLAIAPDIFWRFAPGYDVDPDVPEQMKDAFQNRMKYDADLGVADIEAVIRAARARLKDAHGGGGKVGIVGFCLGGKMAYLAATRTDVDASASYYGGGIDGVLNEAHAIAKPIVFHFAERDNFIPSEVREKIGTALEGNAHATIHVYSGVDHGFAATSGKRRAEEAATLADARTRDFFARHIG